MVHLFLAGHLSRPQLPLALTPVAFSGLLAIVF